MNLDAKYVFIISFVFWGIKVPCFYFNNNVYCINIFSVGLVWAKLSEPKPGPLEFAHRSQWARCGT